MCGKMHLKTSLGFCVVLLLHYGWTQGTYKAAVVEFKPLTSVVSYNRPGNTSVKYVEIMHGAKKQALPLQTRHNQRCTSGRLMLEKEESRGLGLARKLIFRCDQCDSKIVKFTEDCNKKSSVNVGAVWGTLTSGSTYSQLTDICASMDIPPMTYEHFKKIKTELGEGVDIIVFPERGMTGTDELNKIKDHVRLLSTKIPEPAHFIACTNDTNTKPFVTELSCAAKKFGLYVVVNLVENFDDDKNTTHYYNTDVVFDRSGRMIAKYRKISLMDEQSITAGNKTVWFTTDFNVTFGIFSSCDMLFEKPSMELLKMSNVTDIIFTTAWQSIRPFLHALSMQSGYSRAFGVNLLAANVLNPSRTYSGSGIYQANGTSRTFNTFQDVEHRMVVSEVNKIKEKLLTTQCENITRKQVSIKVGTMKDFVSYKQNLQNYSSESVNLNTSTKLINKKICSGESFCCDIKMKIQDAGQEHFVYKMIAFYGSTKSLNEHSTAGKLMCGIVACTNDSISTCGDSVDTNQFTFEELEISMTRPNMKNNFYLPITLTYDYVPLENYHFLMVPAKENEQLHVKMLAQNQSGINSFAVFGRVFKNDGLPRGVINNAHKQILNHGLFLVALFIFAVLKH